jgi:hypothetical protein
MTKLFRCFSAMAFIAALGAIATLVIFDGFNRLRLTPVHQQAAALSLLFIGSSYIGLQLSSGRRWNEMLKEIFLGVAFVLWGCEQFLPPSPWVTAMDSAVILIFVADLSFIIVKRLKRKDHNRP